MKIEQMEKLLVFQHGSKNIQLEFSFMYHDV